MTIDYKAKLEARLIAYKKMKLKKERDELLAWKRRAEPALHQHRCPQYQEEHADDYKRTFEEFWKEIVMNPDGTWNFDQVMRELHDYGMVINEVSTVYMHVTGGLLSKPTTLAEHVIQAFDERVDDHIHEEMDELREQIAKRDKVFDQLKRRLTDGDKNRKYVLSKIAPFIGDKTEESVKQ